MPNNIKIIRTMKITTETILKVLNVITWIIFIGLCIEAGALIVNFIYSIFKPEIIQNLYQKLDLSKLYAYSKSAFYVIYSFIIIIALLKAILFYFLIKLLLKFDLAKPFAESISKQILRISYFTLSIGFLGKLASKIAESLSKYSIDVLQTQQFWNDSNAFIMFGLILLVIAKIFERGIELQSENDLTI